MKTCSVEGCERRLYAKTWCNMHYCRVFRTGQLEPPVKNPGGGKRPAEVKHGTRYAYQIRGCRCEECVMGNRKYVNDRAAQDPTAARDRKRKSRYGVDGGTYAAMLVEQGGACLICGDRRVHEALVVDHCHDSNGVRGLLCRKCNSGLGMFDDDPDRLLAAAAYLLQHSNVLGGAL